MPIPDQVRKQSEEVQRIYASLEGEVEKEADKEEKGASGDSDTTNDTQDSTTDGKLDSPSGTSSEEKKSEDDETALQKYRTLQGMYNAEVPRLRQQNKELSDKIQHMEQLLSTMSPTKEAPKGESEARLISEKELADYGDSIEVMRKVSREEYSPVAKKIAEMEATITRLQGNVVPQVQNLVKTQVANTEQQFWSQLSQSVPSWEKVNNDPAFHEWLLKPDPLSGISRQTILEDAQRSYNVGRVASFFTTWMGSTGDIGGNKQPQDKGSSELQKQVSPGRSRGSTTATPTGDTDKTYSPADIASFFDAVKRGKYVGKEKERDRIERDIFAAQREGRITA
jgi:hypothetical protein